MELILFGVVAVILVVTPIVVFKFVKGSREKTFEALREGASKTKL